MFLILLQLDITYYCVWMVGPPVLLDIHIYPLAYKIIAASILCTTCHYTYPTHASMPTQTSLISIHRRIASFRKRTEGRRWRALIKWKHAETSQYDHKYSDDITYFISAPLLTTAWKCVMTLAICHDTFILFQSSERNLKIINSWSKHWLW